MQQQQRPKPRIDTKLELSLGRAVADGKEELGVHFTVSNRSAPSGTSTSCWRSLDTYRSGKLRQHFDLPQEHDLPAFLQAILGWLVRQGYHRCGALSLAPGLVAQLENDNYYLRTGLSLLTHQKEAVQYAISRNGRVLLSDEQGLGKTWSAISMAMHYIVSSASGAAATALPDRNVLVIAPAGVCLNWVEEWNKLVPPGTVTVVNLNGDKKPSLAELKEQGTASRPPTVYIASYNTITSMLQKRKQSDAPLFPDVSIVVVDESHYLCNYTSQRTQALTPLIQSKRHVIMLSGTPLARPRELYSQLHALHPALFRSFPAFGARYCDPQPAGRSRGRGGAWQQHMTYNGKTHVKELHLLLRSVCLLRRLKSMLPDFSSKRRVPVLLSTAAAAVSDEGDDAEEEEEEVKRKGKSSNSSKPTTDDDFLAEIHKIIHRKVGACVDYVRGYLLRDGEAPDETTDTEPEEDKSNSPSRRGQQQQHAHDKLVVFAHHQIILDCLQQMLQKEDIPFVRIDGRLGPKAKQKAVNAFQNLPAVRCRVALLGLQAAGIGLTLHAAHRVIVCEVHPDTRVLLQAEDRVHRIGQRSDVTIEYLLLPKSVDGRLWALTKSKAKTLTEVLDDR